MSDTRQAERLECCLFVATRSRACPLLAALLQICSCVCFRPKTTWEVWSGGLDCSIVRWDYSRGRVMNTFSTQASTASASATQTLNPPFVNSMSFTRDGAHLFAASGNGEVLLFDARKQAEIRRVTGHTHSVMHVSVQTKA